MGETDFVEERIYRLQWNKRMELWQIECNYAGRIFGIQWCWNLARLPGTGPVTVAEKTDVVEASCSKRYLEAAISLRMTPCTANEVDEWCDQVMLRRAKRSAIQNWQKRPPPSGPHLSSIELRANQKRLKSPPVESCWSKLINKLNYTFCRKQKQP